MVDMKTEDASDVRGPGILVPPPLIFAGTLTTGILIDRYAAGLSTFVGAPTRYVLAFIAVAIGTGLIGAALGVFRSAGTRPEPWQPSSALVAAGVYQMTRNPMYLGIAVAYAGLALAFDSPSALLMLAPLIAVVQLGVIAREERYLLAKFGDAYRGYMTRVRRWL